MVDKVRCSGTVLTYKGTVFTGWGIAMGSGWQTPMASFSRKEAQFRIVYEAGMNFVIGINPFFASHTECRVGGVRYTWGRLDDNRT